MICQKFSELKKKDSFFYFLAFSTKSQTHTLIFQVSCGWNKFFSVHIRDGFFFGKIQGHSWVIFYFSRFLYSNSVKSFRVRSVPSETCRHKGDRKNKKPPIFQSHDIIFLLLVNSSHFREKEILPCNISSFCLVKKLKKITCVCCLPKFHVHVCSHLKQG